jgi:hypothetical protein
MGKLIKLPNAETNRNFAICSQCDNNGACDEWVCLPLEILRQLVEANFPERLEKLENLAQNFYEDE